jgi:phosphate transport system substrate-binding protein
MVMGGIVPVLNLPGVGPGELVIDGPTLARIFLGQVKTWDDTALKKLNPNVKLPSQAVVHRSDGSGTTFNFTDYLSKVSPEWKSKVGSATAVEWLVGSGAKGNEGVANNVANTKLRARSATWNMPMLSRTRWPQCDHGYSSCPWWFDSSTTSC